MESTERSSTLTETEVYKGKGETGLLRRHYPFSGRHLLLPENHLYHYLDEGKGNGEGDGENQETFLLVHGNPTWSFYYRRLILQLRKKSRVVVPDHLGCGLSSRPQDYNYTLANHISNLSQLAEQLKLKQVNLVVHDWGGPIGLGWATQNPHLIKRLIVLNTAAFCSKDIPWRIALCKIPKFGEWIIRRWNGFAFPATFMATKKKMPTDIKRLYLYPYDNYANRIAISRFVEDIPLSPQHPSYGRLLEIEKRLPLFDSIPKLILWGEGDFCFNHRFLARWREIYPLAKVKTFPFAGHYLLEDAPDEVWEEIQLFLEANP